MDHYSYYSYWTLQGVMRQVQNVSAQNHCAMEQILDAIGQI